MDINNLNKSELLELKTQIENKLRETINRIIKQIYEHEYIARN